MSAPDPVSLEYQTVLTASATMRTATDRGQVWQRYIEMHLAVERIMLDLCVSYGIGSRISRF